MGVKNKNKLCARGRGGGGGVGYRGGGPYKKMGSNFCVQGVGGQRRGGL